MVCCTELYSLLFSSVFIAGLNGKSVEKVVGKNQNSTTQPPKNLLLQLTISTTKEPTAENSTYVQSTHVHSTTVQSTSETVSEESISKNLNSVKASSNATSHPMITPGLLHRVFNFLFWLSFVAIPHPFFGGIADTAAPLTIPDNFDGKLNSLFKHVLQPEITNVKSRIKSSIMNEVMLLLFFFGVFGYFGFNGFNRWQTRQSQHRLIPAVENNDGYMLVSYDWLTLSGYNGVK